MRAFTAVIVVLFVFPAVVLAVAMCIRFPASFATALLPLSPGAHEVLGVVTLAIAYGAGAVVAYKVCRIAWPAREGKREQGA